MAAGLSTRTPGSPPLAISIYESIDYLPTTLLGSVSFVAGNFPTVFGSNDHRKTVDFSAQAIPIVAGNEYIVTYETPFGIAFNDRINAPYYAGLVLGNPIPFGRVTTVARNGIDWEKSPAPRPPYTFELATRVWVTPEPAAIHLLALASVSIVRLRRIRH